MSYRDNLHQFITHELLNDPERTISADDDLLLSGTVDSLGIVRLVAHIEDAFNIVVPPEAVTLENFSTLALIDGFLASMVGG